MMKLVRHSLPSEWAWEELQAPFKQKVQGKQLIVLDGFENLTTQSLNELQRLISDLRPSHLDDLGLSSALRWYASDIEGRTSLIVTVEIRGKERDIDPVITNRY